MSHYAPRSPFQPGPDLLAKYEKLPVTDPRRNANARYGALIEGMDQSV